MYEELEYEFAEFKRDIDEGGLTFGRYFDEDEYEDKYSHNHTSLIVFIIRCSVRSL